MVYPHIRVTRGPQRRPLALPWEGNSAAGSAGRLVIEEERERTLGVLVFDEAVG
jgi:hypothetical protein